jgi:cellulose synthase/poly-beta-1,6-N-acetylglucosamine synthase-like glycosyltransferase
VSVVSQQISILIPHYKTLELTKLCLRLIRQHTDPTFAKVIVIDNDSKDESTDYLRSLSWITLIERPSVDGEPGFVAHAKALDLALEKVDTPYVLSIHTDTLVRSDAWLRYLLSYFLEDPTIAGVGSWKLEFKPWCQRLAKWLEPKRKKERAKYLRSHCAMYRVDLVRKLNLSFFQNECAAGEAMHQSLQEAGYGMQFLTSNQLILFIDHINHATSVLNPELSSRKKSVTKGLKRIKKQLASFNADEILQDSSLDR